MSQSVHPSVDELADLRAGLLDTPDVERIESHLTTCDTCADAVAALDQVDALVSADAAVPLRMPEAVAAAIDEALRRTSAERSAGVPSLDDRRDVKIRHTESTGSTSSGAGRRGLKWLQVAGIAAATVVVGTLGVQLLSGMESGNDLGSASSSDAGHAEAGAGDDDVAPGDSGGRQYDATPSTTAGSSPQPSGPLDRTTLRSFAQSFSTESTVKADGAARCVAVPSRAETRRTKILWGRIPAILVVDKARRVAKVYRCHSAGPPLYTTPY